MKYRIKKIENMSLTKQLVCVTLVALVICAIIMGVILPRVLKPFYELSIYAHLKQPSKFIEPGTNKMGDDIAFIIVTRGGAIYTSDNLKKMIPDLSYNELLNLATESKGKIETDKNTYYYLWGERNGDNNLILMDNSYIKTQAKSLLGIIFPTMISTILVTIILLFTWSQYILKKIKKLEKKTKSLITGEKVEGKEFIIDDELNELNSTIEQVDKQLKEKDEYKNMMFQNLSHELKTPISVIQSYIEGVTDGVVEKDEALKIIEEETLNLSSQVQTILQINKIDYMKDSKKYLDSKTDLDKVILEAVEKHKLIRSDVEFIVELNNDKNTNEFTGTEDMWKAVLDNLLGNFVRYAKSKISIIVRDETIILENDGEKLKEDMLSKIFLPYVKGNKGQSGLGLSIVKKTVNIFGYDITAENIDKGVRFVIE